MSAQLLSISTDNPVFYTELLKKITSTVNRRLPFHERLCPEVPGIQDVDGILAWRLQTLLDDIAAISIHKKGNVSATTACLRDDNGTLKTRLYIVFNHEEDEAPRRCGHHMRSIFSILQQIPCKPRSMDGSPKVIGDEFEDNLIDVARTIHNYSFDVFAHRVKKHKDRLGEIREHIEKDRTHFRSEERSTLLVFLWHVGQITTIVAESQAAERISAVNVKILISIYSFWTEHNLLPADALADNNVTLLDNADLWLDERGIDFKLRRWALKIMSFVISANRLFILTQSRRLRKLLEGKFTIRVLTPPATRPYQCDLSPRTVQVALDAALAEASRSGPDWEVHRQAFIKLHSKGSGVTRLKPRVHAELAMVMAMVKGEIGRVLPYIGVSKPSCIMCSHYIHAFSEITGRKITTRGSHGKAYTGWFWPSHPDSGCDGELRQAVLKAIRGQLLRNFEQFSEQQRRNSDSSVGSHGPTVKLHRTQDRIVKLIEGKSKKFYWGRSHNSDSLCIVL